MTPYLNHIFTPCHFCVPAEPNLGSPETFQFARYNLRPRAVEVLVGNFPLEFPSATCWFLHEVSVQKFMVQSSWKKT